MRPRPRSASVNFVNASTACSFLSNQPFHLQTCRRQLLCRDIAWCPELSMKAHLLDHHSNHFELHDWVKLSASLDNQIFTFGSQLPYNTTITIQRRLAWPLRKNDTHKPPVVFCRYFKYCLRKQTQMVPSDVTMLVCMRPGVPGPRVQEQAITGLFQAAGLRPLVRWRCWRDRMPALFARESSASSSASCPSARPSINLIK